MNNYVYILDGKLYVNITNRCHNACSFCIRNTGDGVAGVPLWLDSEPTAADVIAAFDAIEAQAVQNEVVFCGFGEPTEKLDVLVESAKKIKARGYALRLNTNGLGSRVAGRNIAPELKVFDTVSVSLNDRNAERYYEVTRSKFGLEAFDEVLDFAKCCKAENIHVVFTVVDVIGAENIAACEKLCRSLDIPLRVREYVPDNYNGKKVGN